MGRMGADRFLMRHEPLKIIAIHSLLVKTELLDGIERDVGFYRTFT